MRIVVQRSLASKVEVDEQKKVNLVFSFPELTCYVR